MTSLRRLPLRCAALLSGGAMMLLAPGAQAETPEGRWQMTYRVYVGGVHMLDATAKLGLEGDGYRLRMQARTDGFLGRIAAWEVDIDASGKMVPGGLPQPVRYHAVGAWRGEERITTLEYDADGTPRLTVAIPPPEKHREPVPDHLKPDTVDPLAAMIAAMQVVASGGGCEATVPVFDGRQRYDLAFVPKGREVLATTDRGVFSGEAEACGFEIKPIAGAWRDRNDRRSRDGDEPRGRSGRNEVTIWMAPPQPGTPPVPVRVQGISPLGPVIVHLAEITPLPPEQEG